MRCAAFVALLFLLTAPAAHAQQGQKSGEVAESVVGQVGERQTREQTAERIEPMMRINNRIPNRVQSRLRNRIDRDYDPQANAASPFVIAGERVRSAGRAKPR